MANNEIAIGEPRLGWFIDGNPETEMIAVMLRDTGAAIELTVPLNGMFAKNDPYRRWWSAGIRYADDPDRKKHSYEPPRVLLFNDTNGPVVLVGCRTAHATINPRVGQGVIVANYAVLGGRTLNYANIHALRVNIPALAAWTRLSNMEVDVETSENNRVKSVRMSLHDAPPIPLSRRLNLTMKSRWTTRNPRGSFLADETVTLETSVRRARTWDEHLNTHSAVLELVSVAAWRAFGFSTIEAQRIDDPERFLSGGVAEPRWAQVATHRLPKHEPWKKEPNFLFPYSEIGPRGVNRWLRLRKTYGRMVGPLLSILRSDDQFSSTNVVQSGIALEALGYLIDIKKNGGQHLNSRNQMSFKQSLRVILDDMKIKPFDDTEKWSIRATEAYMGAKHPDRPMPDSLEMINTLRENILILRFWTAIQLGAKPASLKRGLERDPLEHEFTAIE